MIPSLYFFSRLSEDFYPKKVVWLFIVEQAVNEGREREERCTQKVINVLYRRQKDHKMYPSCALSMDDSWNIIWVISIRCRLRKFNVINLQGVKGWSESPQKPCLMKFEWSSNEDHNFYVWQCSYSPLFFADLNLFTISCWLFFWMERFYYSSNRKRSSSYFCVLF